MTSRPSPLTLLASLSVHGAALAALFLLAAGEPSSSPLVVDLSKLEAAADDGRQNKDPVAAAQPIRRAPALASSLPARPAPSSIDVAQPVVTPLAPPSPAPAMGEPDVAPATPSEPRQLEPARSAVAAPEPAPEGAARSATPSTPVETGRTGVAGAGTDAVASDGGAARQAPQAPPAVSGSLGGAGTGVALAPTGPASEPGSEYGPYLAGIRRRIQEALQYPQAARRRGVKGTVQLELLIKSDGAISGVSVAGSSSHPLLDDAALEAVRSLGRQPFPAGLLPRPLRVRLPVVFDLQ